MLKLSQLMDVFCEFWLMVVVLAELETVADPCTTFAPWGLVGELGPAASVIEQISAARKTPMILSLQRTGLVIRGEQIPVLSAGSLTQSDRLAMR